MSSARGRWILAATVLGTSVAWLDATIVSIALPTIGRELGASIAGLQWIITGYTLTLAALILLGGSLGDRYGRRRVFLIGVVWFAVASLLCAIAPNIAILIVARMLQGIGGALLTPGSLALIQASFRPDDRGRAVGAWSGLGGVAAALGPFLGRLAHHRPGLALGVPHQPARRRRRGAGHAAARAGEPGRGGDGLLRRHRRRPRARPPWRR